MIRPPYLNCLIFFLPHPHPSSSESEVKQQLSNFQPLPRAGLPEDIGRAVAFFARDETAAFATGADLMVDGGGSLAPASIDERMDK